MGANLAMCASALSKSNVPYEVAPHLRMKLISKIQTCLNNWREVEKRIYPNLPAETRWAFDYLGNNLRASLIEYEQDSLTNRNKPVFQKHILAANEMISHVSEAMPWGLASPHPVDQGGIEMKSNMKKYEMTAALETLSIHRKNAADLHKMLARDPDNLTASENLRMRPSLLINTSHNFEKMVQGWTIQYLTDLLQSPHPFQVATI